MNPNSVLSQSQKPSLPPAHIIQALRPLRSSGVRNGSVRMAGGGRGVGPVRSSSWYTGVCSVSTRLAGCPSAATVVIAPGVTTTWSIPGKYSPGLGGNHLAAASSGVSGVQPRAMSSGRLHRALTIASSSLGGSGAVAQPGVSVASTSGNSSRQSRNLDAGASAVPAWSLTVSPFVCGSVDITRQSAQTVQRARCPTSRRSRRMPSR